MTRGLCPWAALLLAACQYAPPPSNAPDVLAALDTQGACGDLVAFAAASDGTARLVAVFTDDPLEDAGGTRVYDVASGMGGTLALEEGEGLEPCAATPTGDTWTATQGRLVLDVGAHDGVTTVHLEIHDAVLLGDTDDVVAVPDYTIEGDVTP